MSKEIMKQRIEKAQNTIDMEKEQVKRGEMRQRYHFMPQTGWMNDPNGLIYYRGMYHFFYQYNPYESSWGSMYWGHAVSRDLLHWDYLPPALAPSEPYDDDCKGGCFSGSAVERDGKLFLIYTGTSDRGNGPEQAQCLAWSEDGIHFEKYEGNPVATAPEGIRADCFRDPKVWKHGDFYYMVVGASRNGRGLALIYRSEDLFHWEYWNVLAESRGEWGEMWECPDFFRLGDRYVLTFSPMGSGDHTAVYLVGDFDYETGRFVSHISGELDWGLDYYAPQSFLVPDGRRMMAAWANEWEWMPQFKDWGPASREGWCGSFPVLREVKLCKDNTLQLVPIRELEQLRENGCTQAELTVTHEVRALTAGDGVSFELKFQIDLARTNARELVLTLRQGEGKETVCSFDFSRGELRVDRNRGDGWSRGISRSDLYLGEKEIMDVHIFSDQSSLEIFTDQYRNNHSNNVFAGNGQRGLNVRALGGTAVLRNYEAYGLKRCF